MSKIEYPTLDLFIYNLKIGLQDNKILSQYENFWLNLPNQLQQSQFANSINQEDAQRLDFENHSQKLDGCYSRASFEDTDCFRFSCSYDAQIELSDIASTINKLKNSAILPNLPKLAPGMFSQAGYLGQTWMISGWQVSDNKSNLQNLAQEAYKALIFQEPQHQKEGKFLGATVFEMWCGYERWQGIEKNSHVIVIFYPDLLTFKTASTFYNAWRYLFYCQHKILWAYENGRQLKQRLAKELQQSLVDPTKLSKKSLHSLKADLQTNINSLSRYVQDASTLEVQQQTISINLHNYKKQLQDFFPTEKFLEELETITEEKFIPQLEKDSVSLRPGVAILENVTSTIRGMVEIQQAQKERNLNTIIAILGVGLGTSQIASSVIIAQKTPPNNIPFYQTKALWYSIGAGAVASFSLWITILIFFRLKTMLQQRFRP